MKNAKVFIKNGQPNTVPFRLVDGVLVGYVDGVTTATTTPAPEINHLNSILNENLISIDGEAIIYI